MVLEKSQNQQLADYIKKNSSKGYTMDALKYSLIKQGYGRTSVDKAIETANKQMGMEAPKMIEKPVIRYEVLDDEEMRRKVEAQDENLGSGNFLTRFFKKIFG